MHHAKRVLRCACWCLLLALGAFSLAPGWAQAQPPASEVIVPVNVTGSVPNTAGPTASKIEVIPPIVQAQLSFDRKNVEIAGLAPGFAQVRLLDDTNKVLQVINVQVVPADLEIPFGDSKVFKATAGTTIQEVRATNPDIVKWVVSPMKDQVEVTGIGLGSTKLTIIDNKGGFQSYTIAVTVSEKYLRFKIQQAVPTANVYPVQVNKGVFLLNGTVERADDVPAVLAVADSLAPRIINALRVSGVQQVQLDVLIAQVSRNEIRNVGFSWLFNDGNVAFASLLKNPSFADMTTGIGPGAATAAAAASSNIFFGVAEGNFFGFLDALRTEGLAKFLACPKLVTLSGIPATFQSGGRLAVPEPSGLGTNSVRFQDFGTQLSFLPKVLGNGKIYIEVEPRVDIVNQALGTAIGGTVVPGFNTQMLHAAVEMEAGQTFAIGGLIQTEINATTLKVPVLGDLPFLGTAFRNVSHNHTETELLILVTPYLVDPMACNQLPKYVPGQETRIPDDFELFLEGLIESPRGQREIFPAGWYKPAYQNGPSASVYPCGMGGYGAGHGGACGTGNCGHGFGGHGFGHGLGLGHRHSCGTGACTSGCGTGCNGTGFPSSGFTAPVAPPAPAPHAPAAVPAVPAKQLPVSQYEETGFQAAEVMPPITAGHNYQTGAFEQGYALPANPPGTPVSLGQPGAGTGN